MSCGRGGRPLSHRRDSLRAAPGRVMRSASGMARECHTMIFAAGAAAAGAGGRGRGHWQGGHAAGRVSTELQ
jgi:hypothetical protein